jgi:hypothetical protein
MRGTNLVSSQHRPSCIIPEAGQVTEDGPDEPVGNKSRDVFEKDPSGLNFPNDSCGCRPEVSIVIRAFALSSNGVRLAREPRMDAIHSSFPVGCREQPNVSLEHLQVWEPSFGSSLPEDLATVGVPFDGTDGFMPKNEVCNESPSCPGKEV